MSTERSEEQRLAAFVDALDEADCNAPDAEILQEAREAGIDTAGDAARVKGLLIAQVKSARKRALRSAQAQYQEESARLQASTFQLPATAAERRTLFELVVAQQPQYQRMYTTQHRDLRELTDTDIETYLEELAALGILDEFNGGSR